MRKNQVKLKEERGHRVRLRAGRRGHRDGALRANDYEVFDNTYNAPDVATALDLLYKTTDRKSVV